MPHGLRFNLRYCISGKSFRVFFFLIWPYVLWPLITVHKCAETIQGRKLFKGGNYSSAETIWGNTVCNVWVSKKQSHLTLSLWIVSKEYVFIISAISFVFLSAWLIFPLIIARYFIFEIDNVESSLFFAIVSFLNVFFFNTK